MKKLGLIFMLGCIAFFGSCSDDKDDVKPEAKDYAKEVAGRYAGAVDEKGNGGLQVTIGRETAKSNDAVYITYSAKNKVNLELKDFKYTNLPIGDIKLANLDVDGNDQVVNITSKEPIKQTVLGGIDAYVTIKSAQVTGKKVAIELLIDVQDPTPMKVIVKFDGELNDKSGEAKITEVKATHASLEGNASLNETEKKITLYIKDGAKVADLKDVVLEFKLSDKATSNPTSGAKLNIGAGETTITVTAEDGVIKSTYTIVTVSTYKTVYDMEEWEVKNPTQPKDKQYYEPINGWSSSNEGVGFIMMWGDEIPGAHYNVTKSAEANTGKSAAKIETLDTKGVDLTFVQVPKVTAGSLFTGTFKTDPMNTLNSTKFGVDFTKKPLTLKGSYKYTAGPLFLRSTAAAADKFVEEPKTKDKGSINAILYDVTEDKSYITGFNTYKDTRIVAAVSLIVEDQATYKNFEKNFEFVDGKTYDSTKKYRIAIITSSSKDGDTFSGAPGSTLWIDNIEIVAE